MGIPRTVRVEMARRYSEKPRVSFAAQPTAQEKYFEKPQV